MKKTRRLLCMSLAVVMLLGAIPAYAATPMTAAASLIALPLSGKLFTALPVSDNISKALTVKEIESTYSTSTEAKSAPTSAPVEQTTFATTANPAPANRLPDGTTGATVGIAGVASAKTNDLIKSQLSDNGFYLNTCKPNNMGCSPAIVDPTGPFACIIDKANSSPADLVGKTIPAGRLVDVYTRDPNTKMVTFLCQYDTRDGNPLTITVAPGASNRPMLMTAAIAAPTSYNDVKPEDWYYEAVTALNDNGLIHTVFDRDGSNAFKPNELLTSSEVRFIFKRLRGVKTEDLVMSDSTAMDTDTRTCGEGHCSAQYKYSCTSAATRLNVLTEIMTRADAYNVTPLAQTKAGISAADANAIDGIARTYATDAQHGHRGHGNLTWEENYNRVRNLLTRAGELNLVRTPGTPAAIDFDARITRAEFCVMLYRAGLTEFGCCAETNLKKK